MVKIDIDMPKSCADCAIRKIMGCRIANESGWLCNRRDERCLLKSDEPRVMTLEEIKDAPEGTDVWFESYNHSLCARTVMDIPAILGYNIKLKYKMFEPDATKYALSLYNKAYRDNVNCRGWRCWTSRPTPEQMRDTPWEEMP